MSEPSCSHIVPRRLTNDELPLLYKAATAMVMPTRGEGWGRFVAWGLKRAIGETRLSVCFRFRFTGPTDLKTSGGSKICFLGLVRIGCVRIASCHDRHIIVLIRVMSQRGCCHDHHHQASRGGHGDGFAPDRDQLERAHGIHDTGGAKRRWMAGGGAV